MSCSAGVDCSRRLSLHIYGLVPNFNQGGVLMLASDHGWCLPHHVYDHFDVGEDDYCQDLAKLVNGTPHTTVFTILYYAYYDEIECGSHLTGHTVAIVETHNSVELPHGAIWVTKENLKDLKISQEFSGTSAVIQNFIFPKAIVGPRCRIPWMKRGWFRKASSWMLDVLREYGCENLGRVIQKRSKFSTTLLCADTDKGRFYLKATQSSVEEAPFTAWLFKLFPHELPTVLRVSRDLNAILMKGFEVTHSECTIDRRTDGPLLLQFFGIMQIKAAKYMQDLEILAGCPPSKRRTPKYLASRIDSILNDREVQSLFEKEQFKELCSQRATWIEMCNRLEKSGVPCSLFHGDLHFGNNARSVHDKEKFIIFDWFYGAVSHPFFELNLLRAWFSLSDEQVDSYLELWTEFEGSLGKLKEIATLAALVQPLFDAIFSFDAAKDRESTVQGIIVDRMGEGREDELRMVRESLERSGQAAKNYMIKFNNIDAASKNVVAVAKTEIP